MSGKSITYINDIEFINRSRPVDLGPRRLDLDLGLESRSSYNLGLSDLCQTMD